MKVRLAREGGSMETYQKPHKTCTSHQQVPYKEETGLEFISLGLEGIWNHLWSRSIPFSLSSGPGFPVPLQCPLGHCIFTAYGLLLPLVTTVSAAYSVYFLKRCKVKLLLGPRRPHKQAKHKH